MRVALVTVFSHSGCTLKDVAGGYGTVFEVGSSWPARVLERAKGQVASLPPLVLGTLAAQLSAAGHAVEVVEVHRHGGRWDDVPTAPVAVLLGSIVDHAAERAVLRELRAGGTRTIVFGAYPAASPDAYEDVADAVLRGDPEALGVDLLDARGVVDAGWVEDLDRLPFPDWSAFDVPRYRYALLSTRGPTLPAATARGCAYGCSYCPWRVTSPYRVRDPERVAAEVAHQHRRHGVRAFAFRDPLFNLDPERTRELADRLALLDVVWSGEMRADRLDDGLLLRLYRAGLRSLEIGVESVNRAMLTREKRRPPSAATIERVVRTAQRLGIRVICNYLLGLPEDDEESIRDTVAWAKELDSFAVQFTVATPYPGTGLADDVAAGRLPPLPGVMSGFRPVFRHPRLAPEQLSALKEWAYVSYHFRPRYARRFARHALPAVLAG